MIFPIISISRPLQLDLLLLRLFLGFNMIIMLVVHCC